MFTRMPGPRIVVGMVIALRCSGSGPRNFDDVELATLAEFDIVYWRSVVRLEACNMP